MNCLFSGAIACIGGAQKRAGGVASAKYSLTLFAMCVVNFMLFFVLSNYFGYYASIKTLLLITMMLSVEYRLIDICVMSEKCICKFLGSDDELDGDDTDACEKYPP